eukprot:1687014-Ditylum_brightwellii.AAC.1
MLTSSGVTVGVGSWWSFLSFWCYHGEGTNVMNGSSRMCSFGIVATSALSMVLFVFFLDFLGGQAVILEVLGEGVQHEFAINVCANSDVVVGFCGYTDILGGDGAFGVNPIKGFSHSKAANDSISF